MNNLSESSRSSSKSAPQQKVLTCAERSDINWRFVSTRDLWPVDDDRVMFFNIGYDEEKIDFPSKFTSAYGQDFRNHLHLIDAKDNCLAVTICKDNKMMWLPKQSLTLIKRFYNHCYYTELALRYIGEGIFFAIARDYQKTILDVMYQDKYVRDILMAPKLKWIKEEFGLDFFEVPFDNSVFVNRNVVIEQQSTGDHQVGDGASIELSVGKSYSGTSRLYIPKDLPNMYCKLDWTHFGV